MKLEPQHYSKIARDYIYELRESGEDPYVTMVTYGNLNMMENLATLFGWDDARNRRFIEKYKVGTECGPWELHRARFQFVLEKLDRESKQENALFKKYYLNYPGIINRPTRCFELKELAEKDATPLQQLVGRLSGDLADLDVKELGEFARRQGLIYIIFYEDTYGDDYASLEIYDGATPCIIPLTDCNSTLFIDTDGNIVTTETPAKITLRHRYNNYRWYIDTNIAHESFSLNFEGIENYCRGIAFYKTAISRVIKEEN